MENYFICEGYYKFGATGNNFFVVLKYNNILLDHILYTIDPMVYKYSYNNTLNHHS